MPTQSIDFSAVGSATFDGTNLSAINLNGAEIWSAVSFPTGTAQVMGVPEWYEAATQVQSGVSNMSPGDSISVGLAMTNSAGAPSLVAGVPYQSVLGENNTIEVWVSVNNSLFTSYMTTGNSHDSLSTTGPAVLSHSELVGLTNHTKRHGKGRVYNNNPDNGHPIGDPHTVGDGVIHLSSVYYRMFEYNTSKFWVKAGYYDASKTFIVDPIFNNPQTVTVGSLHYGLYGPVSVVNTSVITKTGINSFSVTYTADSAREIHFQGAVNGYLPDHSVLLGADSTYTGTMTCSNGEFRVTGPRPDNVSLSNFLTLKLP